MDSLFKKLDELSDLLKQFNATIKTPKTKPLTPRVPKMGATMPKMSTGMAPKTKKDPVKVAEQLKNKDPKPKVRVASFNNLGQWNLT